MSLLRVSLEQWQVFVYVIKEGNYLNASLKLSKTQPSISYAIKKIEETLDIKLFKIQGRKSVLTKKGLELYNYAAKLVQFAGDIELQAKGKINKIEHTIRLAVDEIFPIEYLMKALNIFSSSVKNSTIILSRGILSGPHDMLERGEADIAITFKYPKNIISEPILETTSSPYVCSNHPLSIIKRPLMEADLLLERQIIVMDTNKKNSIDFGWLNPSNGWYVDSLEMKLQMIAHGLGYGWINDSLVKSRKINLKKLHLKTGSIRKHPLYIAYKSEKSLAEVSQLLLAALKKSLSS